MFYESQKMKLECVRVVKESEINDILICQDLNTASLAATIKLPLSFMTLIAVSASTAAVFSLLNKSGFPYIVCEPGDWPYEPGDEKYGRI